MQASPMSPPSPIEAPSSQPPLAASSKRLVTCLIAVAFFMESLDTTILNTAVADDRGRNPRCSAQDEVGARKFTL